MDATELKTRLGRRVQALREGKGLTQEQLAEQIGRTVDTVGNIERGANSTRVETAARIAAALGVELPELFEIGGGDPIARRRRRVLGPLVAQMEQLDEATFEATLRVIEGALALTRG